MQRAAASRKAPSLPERLLDERRASNRADWARRHPRIAASERRLRKERAALEQRWSHKNDGTPETHEHASKRHQGALARLYQSGAIDSEQLGSAVEIATVAERIGSDVAVKTASLETRVDVTRIGDGGFFEALGAVRREMAYTAWRAELRQPAAVLDMIVADVGVTAAAALHHMSVRKARRILLEALNLWPEILGGVCKAVDDKDLAIAHARLAA